MLYSWISFYWVTFRWSSESTDQILWLCNYGWNHTVFKLTSLVLAAIKSKHPSISELLIVALDAQVWAEHTNTYFQRRFFQLLLQDIPVGESVFGLPSTNGLSLNTEEVRQGASLLLPQLAYSQSKRTAGGYQGPPESPSSLTLSRHRVRPAALWRNILLGTCLWNNYFSHWKKLVTTREGGFHIDCLVKCS